MCIAVIAHGESQQFPLIFAANRDEMHARPTAVAGWWPDAPAVLGGRDLVAGGSWLAVNRAGWLAAVTNLPAPAAAAPRSRGALVRELLTGARSAETFFAALEQRASDYAPFNLLGFDGRRLYYFGSDAGTSVLDAGVHALSNAPYGAGWPKLTAARDGMRRALTLADPEPALFSLLAQGIEEEPSASGADPAWRRSKLFIRDRAHGTRSSTVVLITQDGRVRFVERSFDAHGKLSNTFEHAFPLRARQSGS